MYFIKHVTMRYITLHHNVIEKLLNFMITYNIDF